MFVPLALLVAGYLPTKRQVVPARGKAGLNCQDGKRVRPDGAKLVSRADTAVAFPSARAAAVGSFCIRTAAADVGAPGGEYFEAVEWKER